MNEPSEGAEVFYPLPRTTDCTTDETATFVPQLKAALEEILGVDIREVPAREFADVDSVPNCRALVVRWLDGHVWAGISPAMTPREQLTILRGVEYVVMHPEHPSWSDLDEGGYFLYLGFERV